MPKNITALVEVFDLGTEDQVILRKGNFDRRISLELAGTLSWAKRNGYTYLGEHTAGLVFTDENSFSIYQGQVYFSSVNGYSSVSNTPSTESALYVKSDNWILQETLKYKVGQRVEIHSAQIPDWLLKADGALVSRTVDNILWEHAENSSLLVSQTLKDADPEQYAMYYGDGDGSTTFSLPNWYLGHFARGNPAGVALGETLGDAMRNLTGSFTAQTVLDNARIFSSTPNGVLVSSGTGSVQRQLLDASVGNGTDPSRGHTISFDASAQVPTAIENRPKSGHINICIERGKIPA